MYLDTMMLLKVMLALALFAIIMSLIRRVK